MNNKSFATVLYLLVCLQTVVAQEFNLSPYSVFGIGDIVTAEGGRMAGMAGAGIGMAGGQLLNTSNPASFAFLDSTTFLFDLSGSSRGSFFSNATSRQKSFNANLTGLTAGMHIAPYWSAGITVQPYSSVSYSAETEGCIEGSGSKVKTTYEGSGGVTRFSLINSVRLSESFSLGAELMILHGNIEKTATQNLISVARESNASDFLVSLGLMYSRHISPDLKLGAGVTYSHNGTLNFTNKVSVTDNSESLLYSNSEAPSSFTIPRSFGTGITLEGTRVIISAGYRYQKWSLSRDEKYNLRFRDTHHFSSGIAYTPARAYPRNYFELIQYQAGMTVSNSYLTFKDVNPVCFEITTGAAFPCRGGTQLGAALAWGKRGSMNEGMIREDYFRIALCISFAERWFVKRMYE